jgi:hypothetical protein
MITNRIRLLVLLVGLLPALIVDPAAARAQDLQTKLEQQTDFVPQIATPPEQLIEVARRFGIPMRIEWLESSESRPTVSLNDSRTGKQSVFELITRIVGQSAEHQVSFADGSVHVYSPAVLSHPFNFLNLRVGSFALQEESLYGAQAALRTAINMTLYPELYKHGWGGGYGGVSGYDPEGLFYVRNITFSGTGLTIRDILDRIAKGNGNSLWVVLLKPEELQGEAPYWEGKPRDTSGHSPLNSRWDFIPLADLGHLTNERITVELSMAGCFAAKRVSLPVWMEQGLGRHHDGSNGEFSSDGSYCGYSIDVTGVTADLVTLHFNLVHKPYGRTETQMNQDVSVSRGKRVERSIANSMKIIAYLEGKQSVRAKQ